MKKIKLILFLIIAALAVAAFTNPKETQHKEAIRTKFDSYLNHAMDNNIGNKDLGQALGGLVSGLFMDKFIDQTIHVENKLIFSITTFTWNGETGIIGIGAFGKIFFSKKMDEAVDKALEEL